jgi:hypothetical protein
MAARGPVPKRSSERRRTNKPVDGAKITTAPAAKTVVAPVADDAWHKVALTWYDSLALSGQSRFYEPSDWATAFLIAESISRDLSPQVVGFTEKEGAITATIPLKGASLSAYLKAMSSLLVTEGDRRRSRVELERGAVVDEDEAASVTALADFQSKLGASA